MTDITDLEELNQLCNTVKELCREKNYKKCRELICKSMSKYPDSAIPNNLYGIILEKTGDHLCAMNHFRAAWALDPTYRPANHNLHNFGTFLNNSEFAFTESDIKEEKTPDVKIVYDERGIGHVSKIKKNNYLKIGKV